MCCSVRKAVFTNTSIYVGESEYNGKYVHTLMYQNTAETLDGPNAMVLPIPSAEEMGPENIIDTSKFKDIFNTFKKSFGSDRRSTKSSSRSFGLNSSVDSIVKVFDSGSYTVVLANNVNLIQEALQQVPEDKRPAFTDSFLEGYGKLYPKSWVAVCCFNGAVSAEPLLWWYKPKDKNNLFIPTMDAHDGNAPDPNAKVGMDHSIYVGSTLNEYSKDLYLRMVNYGYEPGKGAKHKSPPHSLLPTYLAGRPLKIPSGLKNGDMNFDLEQFKGKKYLSTKYVVLHRNLEQYVLTGNFEEQSYIQNRFFLEKS